MSVSRFALVRIPDELSFDDLRLALKPDGRTFQFDWGPIREIMRVNTELSLSHDEEVIDLIGAWYSGLRLRGYRHQLAEQHLATCDALREFGVERLVAGPDTPH